MTGRTHDLAALTALHVAFVYAPVPAMSVATAIGAFAAAGIGGLTPDIDQPTAELWGRIPAGSIIGRMISPILGSHRMISHSLVGIALAGYLLDMLLDQLAPIVLVDMIVVWWAFMIGFCSHILIDLFTRDGVPLLFPIPWKIGFPPLSSLRIKTGGFVEKTLLYPGLLLTNGYLVYTHTSLYMDFIKNNIH